jgi:hypothetical protein
MHRNEPRSDLGPCCCCGSTRKVRNIVMLPRRGSVPGTGWSCFVCDLPADGACYVACDRCVENDVPPREVVRGYAASGEREPIENLSPEPFDHDMTLHGTGD